MIEIRIHPKIFKNHPTFRRGIVIARNLDNLNINSIEACTPVGGDDVIQAGGNLELRPADGSETFTPLSNPESTENPDAGEVIYVVCLNQKK